MSQRHYKHAWKVTALRAKPGTPSGFVNTHSDYFEGLPNGIEIDKLRIQFQIEKTLDKEPNTCELVITNLAAGTRVDLCKKPLIVRVDAGYEEDGGARHLFAGDLRYGWSKQDGTEWLTTLQLADGSRAFQHARVSRSYKAGTSVLTAVRDAARTMGVLLPKNIEISTELGRSFAAGVQLHGHTRDELTRLLAPFGYSWSIQSGRLVILKDNEVDTTRALVISKDTGMIGSPEFGAPEKDGKSPTLTIRTLLYPQVSPGVMLSVQSDSINGIFRAERVVHSGDSHGEDWYTEIEAKPSDATPK